MHRRHDFDFLLYTYIYIYIVYVNIMYLVLCSVCIMLSGIGSLQCMIIILFAVSYSSLEHFYSVVPLLIARGVNRS